MHYAILKSKDGQSQRVPLPAAVGSGADCDVIVNVAALPEHAYTLAADGGALTLLRHASDEPVPLATLGTLGLRAMGPVKGSPVAGMKRRMNEALAREAAAVRRLPALVRRLVLGTLPQPVRLSVLTLALVGVAVATRAALRDEAPRDLADVPQELRFDAVRDAMFGSNPANPKFLKGYERGASFAVTVPIDLAGKAALMQFTAGGLNIGKEVALLVNGKSVFESEAEAACSQELCRKSVRIPPGLLAAGVNRIKFEHRNPESSWFIAKLSIRALPEFNEVEREEAVRWLELARRAYDERNIVPENLVTATDYLERVRKLTGERSGGDELRQLEVRAEAMKADVDQAFAKLTDDLKIGVNVDEQLGKAAEAEQALNQLLRLYPDPNSETHAAIAEHLRNLKERKK